MQSYYLNRLFGNLVVSWSRLILAWCLGFDFHDRQAAAGSTPTSQCKDDGFRRGRTLRAYSNIGTHTKGTKFHPVVNIVDLHKVWRNGRWRSTVHRVTKPSVGGALFPGLGTPVPSEHAAASRRRCQNDDRSNPEHKPRLSFAWCYSTTPDTGSSELLKNDGFLCFILE